MNATRTLLAPIAALFLAACSGMYAHSATPAMAKDGVLVNPAGMTLYTFDKDPADATKSACNGPCATNWPPLAADKGAMASGDWKPITRDDGSSQWSYKGKPVYLWIKDQKPGDRTGDGVNGVWRLAKP
jgi:predicted lipoprotein with Yx(FWY)xxD motif